MSTKALSCFACSVGSLNGWDVGIACRPAIDGRDGAVVCVCVCLTDRTNRQRFIIRT